MPAAGVSGFVGASPAGWLVMRAARTRGAEARLPLELQGKRILATHRQLLVPDGAHISSRGHERREGHAGSFARFDGAGKQQQQLRKALRSWRPSS